MKLSIASLGGEPGTRYLEQVKLAERLGFHALFHNDKKWARDVFSRLGAATQVTSRIGLGTSVIDPYTRHAASWRRRPRPWPSSRPGASGSCWARAAISRRCRATAMRGRSRRYAKPRN